MAIRIHIASVQGAYLREYESAYVPQFKEELKRHSASEAFALEDDPDDADVIILWEGFEYKTPAYIETLGNDPLIRQHADRVYTINYDDHPEGFLAGLYTSLEQPFYHSESHRVWPFFLMNNPEVYEVSREQVLRHDPTWLFSFTGAASHRVRKELFRTFSEPSSTYRIEHVKRWYDHGAPERRSFVDVALASSFCLCPHGYCAYTPRITEVMAMARVPVIIADDWIPFSFNETIPYYIKVSEKDIAHLPDILANRRSDVEELRINARNLWEKYCSPARRAVALMECIRELAGRPGDRPTYQHYRDQWSSKVFLEQLGWRPYQKSALRVEQHLRRWIPGARVPGVSDLMRYRNAPNLK